MGKVVIYGAQSLVRYTEGILVQGFQNNSWNVVEDFTQDTDAAVYQVHGAPQAEKEDNTLLRKIAQDILKEDVVKRVVLLHRPDEIQLRYPKLRDILVSATHPIGLVFLGDMHIDDDFFRAENVIKKVIPHGFFDVSVKLQIDPIIIGSHTTWGEMRSIEHIFKLLGDVFRLGGAHPILGYVGGKPQNQLQVDFLTKQWSEHNADVSVVFMDVHSETVSESFRKKNVILFDSRDTMSEKIGLTYNVQLYYLNNKIRTGESSGSLHSSVSIPVILEMNGSEVIEDLRVIKIPYASRDDITTVNFKAGAERVLHSINDRSYVTMLKHNLAQSKKFSPKYVAKECIRLFEQMR